jgi:hypothetical protein
VERPGSARLGDSVSFQQSLIEVLNEADDPFCVEVVAEAAGSLLGQIAVGIGRVQDIGDPTDVLEVTRSEDGVDLKAVLKVPIDQWTDNSRVVMFSLLHEGFDWVVDEQAFVLEMSIP